MGVTLKLLEIVAAIREKGPVVCSDVSAALRAAADAVDKVGDVLKFGAGGDEFGDLDRLEAECLAAHAELTATPTGRGAPAVAPEPATFGADPKAFDPAAALMFVEFMLGIIKLIRDRRKPV